MHQRRRSCVDYMMTEMNSLWLRFYWKLKGKAEKLEGWRGAANQTEVYYIMKHQAMRHPIMKSIMIYSFRNMIQ